MRAERNEETQVSMPSDREIVVTRDFAAPKALVFDAFTKPEHVKRWQVCPQLTMPVCEIDLREGGKWRWVLREEGGREHATSGQFERVARPDEVVFTSRYEPVPGSDHVVTLTFEERADKTRLTQRFVHTSQENRDAHLQSGIASGLEGNHERLDAVLESLSRLPPAVISVPTGDLRKAFGFYRALGLRLSHETEGDAMPEPVEFLFGQGTHLMLVPRGGFQWVIGKNTIAERGASECVLGWHLASRDEVDALLGRAEKAGGSVVEAPAEKPWGYAGTFHDLDGHLWMVVSRP